jgi:four helix bundle protein
VSGNAKENIMSMIQRFEDIQAWQEARKLVKMVYSLTSKESFSKDFGMRDQIRRASVSVMANIAEEFDCDSKVEFARFLGIARRSAVEVQSILYAALDTGYINDNEFNLHYEQVRKAKTLAGGFKHSLTNKSSGQ